jgi:flagellin-like protein
LDKTRLTRNRKALSPVVASIILIAVTVAVSIAVAAWMGALTFTFMGTEQVKLTKITWTWSATPSNRQFQLTLNNTGTKDVTINQVLVNYAGVTGTISPGLTYILKTTKSVILTVNYPYANGTHYDISIATASGYKYTGSFTGGQDSG